MREEVINDNNDTNETTNNNCLTQMIETGFTGIYSTFTYSADRSSKVYTEVQRFWARNVDIDNDILKRLMTNSLSIFYFKNIINPSFLSIYQSIKQY